jgi:hypothetical protein
MNPAPEKTAAWTAGEVLNAAADLLEKPGAWTQRATWRKSPRGRLHDGFPTDEATCFCITGALMKVAGSHHPLIWECRNLLDAATGFSYFGIEDWNDTKGRTQAEVVATLRRAALSSASPDPALAGGG